MIQQALALTPGSRRTDSYGSLDAEERIKSSGQAAAQQRQVLAAFCKHPGSTTKEIAELENLDRIMVARRAPELSPVYLVRIKADPDAPKGSRQLRWMPTEAGLRIGGAA